MNSEWPSHQPFMPDNYFAELLWDKGQPVAQGLHSDRASTSSSPQEMEDRVVSVPKLGKFKEIDVVDPMASGLSSFTRNELDAQDDDTVPWANYTIESPLQNNYRSEFLNEFCGADFSLLTANSNALLDGRSNGLDQAPVTLQNANDRMVSKAVPGDSEPSRIRTTQLCQQSQRYQSAGPSTISGAVGTKKSSSSSRIRHNLSEALLNSRLQKQGEASSKPLQQKSCVGVVNFPQFSRMIVGNKANLQGDGGLGISEKTSVETTSGMISGSAIQKKSVSVLPSLRIEASPKPPQEGLALKKLKAICQEGTHRKEEISGCSKENYVTSSSSRWPDNVQNSSFAPNMVLGRHETGKGPEVIVVSSACSGSSAEPLPVDAKHREKRKNPEEDAGYQSENLEDAPLGSKKPSFQCDMDAKKGRAAEVHNLSERRRRDKINEKIRGLQDLIPNCNKVDKASVLDEAIEYIKTLQMQLQMISMQNGLCMPLMMAPTTQQQMCVPMMAHLSPMGLGLGYGMGMYDMNGVPRFPMIPFQPIPGSQFPCPSIRDMGMNGIPGSSSHQMFGMPQQGLPVSVPCPLPFAASPGLSKMTSLVSEASGMTASQTSSAADIASSLHSKDQQHRSIHLDKSKAQEKSQGLANSGIHQTGKECLVQSSLGQTSNQTLHDTRNEALNPITDYGT